MTVGDISTFAIESEITRAFEKPSWRGLGFFVIHAGQTYGIKSPDQSMLACSFDEVGIRITGRGTHQAPFAEAAAIDIANAYTSSVYLDSNGDKTYFGLSEAQFTKTLYSSSLVWAPDGDEAFDDGSYVLQFDVGDRVRVIAFKRPDSLVDPASVRDIWLSSDTFYSALREWRDTFIAEWESLPKHSPDTPQCFRWKNERPASTLNQLFFGRVPVPPLRCALSTRSCFFRRLQMARGG